MLCSSVLPSSMWSGLEVKEGCFVFCFRDNILSAAASYKRWLVLVFSHCKLTLGPQGKNNTPLPLFKKPFLWIPQHSALRVRGKRWSLACDNNPFLFLIEHWKETAHSSLPVHVSAIKVAECKMNLTSESPCCCRNTCESFRWGKPN